MSRIPKATPRGARQMYVPGSSPEAQNANLRAVVDELRAHISELKKDLEAEKGHVKELKREKLAEVKSARDQEQQKAALLLSDLRAKLGHEKQRELASLRESLTKQHDQEINRLLKQKQELLARSHSESQRDREMHFLKVKQQVWAEAKEEVKRTFEMDKGKLLAEIDELRRSKRKLEEELNDAVAGDRQRAADLRRQWGEHQREMDQLKKDARRDIQRLMEELKSKDRVISELEKELGHKSGYSQRLQLEKESLGNLLNLSKMAESWDRRSSFGAAHESSVGSQPGFQFGAANGNDEDDKKLHKKIADLNAMLRKLEERNKQLIEDKADLERKMRTSSEVRNTTPLIEKNKRLLRKIKDLEQGKKKLDERNKALSEENQKLRSLKENMRCRLERENQSLRNVLSKERQQLQWGTNSQTTNDAADKEEELRKLRVEVQEQFLEIVELKQAALEQERLQKTAPDHPPSRLPVPTSRLSTSSLSPFSLDEEVGVRSRSGSFDISIASPSALSDCEDGLDEDFVDEQGGARHPSEDSKREGKPQTAGQRVKKLLEQNKELEEKISKLEWTLQDSKDQNELLEFRILELEEENSAIAGPTAGDESKEKVTCLEDQLVEKDNMLQSLQQEVESQRERVRQMEEAQEKELISMHRSHKLANEDEPTLHQQLHLAKMRVCDLERTEAHLHSHIQELEDQVAQLQEDIHLGLAERNRERAELEAEISSLREATKELQSEKDQAVENLKAVEECRESWQEEEEKLLKKLKKKEQTETSFKKQIEKLKSQLSVLQESSSPLDITPVQEVSDSGEDNNRVTMEDPQDVKALQQKVEQLELVKESLQAKLRDVEELVLNSDFASEESLREKIAELEQSNKSLTRQLKQSQASDVDSKEVVERAAADARDNERTLRDRIQELQQSEQSLLERVAQLEEQDNAWRAQVESLQDRVQDLETLRQELKGKLDAAEEHIEELQVAEKFARDELSASHGASSFLGESLGLMGELGSLAEEELVEYEEEDVQETARLPQEEAMVPESLMGSVAKEDDKVGELQKENRISELEKSETELMEKVQALEETNVELGEMCQALKNQAFELADDNESLKQKVQELEELQVKIPETLKAVEEAEEEKMALQRMVEELESEIEHLKQENTAKDVVEDEHGAKGKERELIEELEAVKEENLELSDRLADEHKKLQELKAAYEDLKEQLQTFEDQHVSGTTDQQAPFEELHQELEKSRTEKAQLEEQFQTELKDLKDTIEALEVAKESLQQQLESSEFELRRLEEVSSELHAELEHKIEELEGEKEELLKQLGEALEQKHDSSAESDDVLLKQKEIETENQDLLLKLSAAEEQCSKLREQVETLEKQLQDRKSELTVARKDSLRKSLECGDSSRELADAKKRLKELEDVESQFFDQAEVLNKMVKEQEDLKEQVEDLEETKEKLIAQQDQLESQNQELKELRESFKELENAKENLQDRLDVETHLLEEASGKLQVAQEQLETTKEELRLQREKLEEAEARGKEMEDQLTELEKLEVENLKLEAIVNAQEETEEAPGLDSKESVETLKQRILDLTQQEEHLQQKVRELEERQAAYEETIAQADLIVSETHQKLSEQNELLEAKEQELQQTKEQLDSLSQSEGELSHKLQLLEDTSHELQRKSELLDIGEEKLKDLKKSLSDYEEKCQLQEGKLLKLKQAESELAVKVQSLEKSNQPENVDTVETIIEPKIAASEESTLQETSTAASSSTDSVEMLTAKLQAMTQNEAALHQRIEEFQAKQAAFEETLVQADIMLTEANQKLEDKTEVCNIQENELLELKEKVARLGEENLTLESHRAAAEEVEKKLQLLEEESSRELKMKRDELDNLKEELAMLTQNLELSDERCKELEEKLKQVELSESGKEGEQLGLEETRSQEELIAALKKRILDMTNHEEKLQQRIYELEERQGAFEETLAQADVIMTERESKFLEKIDELQSSHSDLQEKLRRVSETRKQEHTSQSSDEDDDSETQDFSVFSTDAKRDDSGNAEEAKDERQREIEGKILQLEGEIEKLQVSEKELLKVIEDYKTLEESLKSTNDEMLVELDLARDKIKELESALKNGGPDNDLQAQLEELKAGVQLHEETNLRLKEEIRLLKGTICELQDQLLQSPNQQISEDGFIKPDTYEDEIDFAQPEIVISDEADISNMQDSTDLSSQVSLKQQMEKLKEEICKTKDQLKNVIAARDFLQADVEEKNATVQRLERANKFLQDDVDVSMAQIEELEQKLSQISKQDNKVTRSSLESESESERQNVKELQETIASLKSKLEDSENEKLKSQEGVKMRTENVEIERKDLENSEQQLKVGELEKSVDFYKKELASANSDRVKTTNRLTEIVQFNREIKKDLKELEESNRILKEDNSRLQQEKDLLNEKLSTVGISGKVLLRRLTKNQQTEEAVTKEEEREAERKGGEQRTSRINESSQTGPLTYIPNECLLATVLIEEFEMTLKEFLEALPTVQSPTDPVLLKEGKNYFVEFNKLFIGKCRTPRARLLRNLTKNLPPVKVPPEKRKKKPIYPSLPGEECSKQEAGDGAESKMRPLEAASPTTKKRMLDEFVSALWELPLEAPSEIDWDKASMWYPDDGGEMDEDSIDTSEYRQLEEVDVQRSKSVAIESEAAPLPESTPPESVVSHKRTGSMSSDSLAGDPPPLPAGSPPRRVIRDDSLEIEDEDDDKGDGDGLPPPLPSTSPPRKPDAKSQSPGRQTSFHSSFGSDSLEDHDGSENHGLPPPLPKTSPPRKSIEHMGQSETEQPRSSIFGEGRDSRRNVPYQNGQYANGTTTDPDSDVSSTDTLTDHEAFLQDSTSGKDASPNWDHRDGTGRANASHRPSSFDSGMDTVSSITEQEVEAITAASVFAGPDHSLKLPKPPGVREGAGSSLAKPSTPMWLKQMMDWQTAEKEKEETDLVRLKTSIDTMEKQLQEKEEVVKELKKSEESLKKKLQDYGDLRPLKFQLQSKEIDIQDKERQVALLKSEVKQKEREILSIKATLEDVKYQLMDTNQTDKMARAAEIARLKQELEDLKHQRVETNQTDHKLERTAELARLTKKLEQSQERLKDKEQQLRTKEEEERRVKEDIDRKEKELSSKAEALEKKSEELKNLEAALKDHRISTQNSDQTDAARPHGTSLHDTKPPDTRSHDAMSGDTGSHELHLASALEVLGRENEELRSRVQRLASVEDRWAELQEQLAESHHDSRDRGALERKLQMAEDMLQEKTREELRLAEDNAALEDRVRHLQEQKKKRDGIEEDYRRIKEQFEDMEHKKNEAEISVAPLKAKVSYLLQKCKERDAIIQRFAAELEQLRPDRTEQLLSEISDLTAVNLPGEEVNRPSPVSSSWRGRKDGARGGLTDRRLRDGDIRRQRQRSDKISKSLNDIRVDELSDDDELGRLPATRGRTSLDPLSGSLDDLGLGGEGISLSELMRRTSKSRSQSHLTPSRGVDEVEADLLMSVLDTSPSRTLTTSRSRTDAYSPSRLKKGTPYRYNSLSHKMPNINADPGLLDGPYREDQTRAHRQDILDSPNLSLSTQSPLFSSVQQSATRTPHHLGSPSGDVSALTPSSVNGIHQMYSSPTVLHSGNASQQPLVTSSIAYSTPLATGTIPAISIRSHSQLGSGYQTSNSSQGQATVAAPTVPPMRREYVTRTNAAPQNATAVTINGSAYGVTNGSHMNASELSLVVGTVGGTSNRSPAARHGGMQSSTDPGLAKQRLDSSPMQGEIGVNRSLVNGSAGLNSGIARRGQPGHGTSIRHAGKDASKPETTGPTAVHHGIAEQAGTLVNGNTRVAAQSGDALSVEQPGEAYLPHSGPADFPISTAHTHTAHAHMNGTLCSHQADNTPAMHPGSSSSSSAPAVAETSPGHSGGQQAYGGSINVAQSQSRNAVSNQHHGQGASDTHPGVRGHIESAVVSLSGGSSIAPLHHGGMCSSEMHTENNSLGLVPTTDSSTSQYNVMASPNRGDKGHVSSSPSGGIRNVPLHHGIHATALHPGNNSMGIAPTPGMIRSQFDVTAAPSQQTVLQSPAQQMPHSSMKPNSKYHNGSFVASSSPSSRGQLPPPTSHSPLTPSVNATGAQISWLPNNITSQPLIASTGAHPSHSAPFPNGTASPQRGIPLHHVNGVRGVDEPDQRGVMHHGPRAPVNGRGDQPVFSRGALERPITGVPHPPRGLSVSKVIGRHGAVLTWHPPDMDDLGRSNGLEVIGYKIFVDGRQKQLVTSAHLTKALVDGINLRTVQTFGIQTVSATGQASPIIKADFEDPGLLSSSWSDSVMTESSVGRGTVVSDGSSVISEELQERLFMAVYNYNPIEHSPNHYPTYELAFEEGDIVTVYGPIRADGFYQGKVRGKRGLVPSNFIEEISMSGSHHSKKRHGHSKSHKGGSGANHSEVGRRGSKERARTPTKSPSKTPSKTPSKSSEERKRHGPANTSRI